MPRLYAKTKALVQVLSFLTVLFLLTGCSVEFPSGIWGDTAVVSKNPNDLPDISWQTQDQREELAKQVATPVDEQPLYPQAPSPATILNNTEPTEPNNQNDELAYDRNYTYPAQPPLPQEQFQPMQNEVFQIPEGQVKQEIMPYAYPQTSYNKVKVSILLPLSGSKASLGQSMLNAAQMALFDVGSDNFELSPIDTKGTEEGAVKAAMQAVQDHTDLILGPIFAENLKAIKPVTKESKTPVISFTTDWTLADSNTYIMGFLPFTQVARVAKYAQKKGYSNFAVYAPKTEYCDVVIRTLKNTGAHISRIGRYSPNQPDLSALVRDFVDSSVTVYKPDRNKRSVKNGYSEEETETEIRLEKIMREITDGADIAEKKILDFDILMLPVGSEGLKTLINQLELNEIDQSKVKYIGTGLWDDEKLAHNPSLYGGWFAAPDPQMRLDFEHRFKENFGEKPMRIATLAYDATALAAVLARVPNRGISPYSSAVLTNPRGFTGIDGLFRFRNDGLSERGLAILEIQAGKARVIDSAPTAFIMPSEQ